MKALLYGLLGLLALANVGCSSGIAVEGFEQSSSSFSSRPQGSPFNQIAICNKITGHGFDGTSQLYQSPNGVFSNETIRLELNKIPGPIHSNGENLKIFRWLANSSGYLQDQNSVQFYIEVKETQKRISGVLNELTPSDIVFYSRQGFSQTLDAQAFLDRVYLVVTDLALEWDALKVQYTSSSTQKTSTDFLIPGFNADPNVYAIDHPTALINLHPNQALASSGRNTSNFFQLTNTQCP